MQFLYPIGLLALAGLIIPLIIHLWNVKQQQTLKIGSISLLGESAQVTSKSYRITDWLLFILRCVLIVLIAFLLAQPYLTATIEAKNKGGWILIERSKLPKVYQQERRSIDSLLKKDYEIHDFNVGFTLLTLEDTVVKHEISKSIIAYGSLLNQLNTLIPTGASVYLYTDRLLNRFGEKLPITNYQLKWKTINDIDTISSWITEFAGKKLEAKSTQMATSYQPIANAENPVINVAINETGGSNDRKYVIAALNAIANFTNRKIEINHKDKKYDIGFWLSEQPVTSAFKNSIKTQGQTLIYAKGKEITAKSIINTDAGTVALNKRIASDHNEFTKIWTDGFGNPILSKQIEGGLTFLHFYSRFNPQWSDLVWSEIFVKALMPIVIKDQRTEDFGFEDNGNDQRILPVSEHGYYQRPELTKEGKITSSKTLGNVFWIIALLIFALERILSFSKKTTYVKN